MCQSAASRVHVRSQWGHVRCGHWQNGIYRLSVHAGDPRLLYGRPTQQPQQQQQQQYSAYNSAAPAAASAQGYAQPVDPRRAIPSDPRLSSAPGMARLELTQTHSSYNDSLDAQLSVPTCCKPAQGDALQHHQSDRILAQGIQMQVSAVPESIHAEESPFGVSCT